MVFGKTYAREHGEGETSGCGGMVSNLVSCLSTRLISNSAVYGIVLLRSVSIHACKLS